MRLPECPCRGCGGVFHPQRRAERRARGHRVRLRQLRQLRRQFTDEDGISWYYVLLKGTDAYASCYLYAPADAFDADSAALWISGTVIE